LAIPESPMVSVVCDRSNNYEPGLRVMQSAMIDRSASANWIIMSLTDHGSY